MLPTLLVTAGFVLGGFGSLSDHLIKTEGSWQGFEAGVDSKDPLLMLVRAERIREASSCSAWIRALETFVPGVVFQEIKKSRASPWMAWNPWGREDFLAVAECHKFPCQVKLDSREVAQMSGVPESQRQELFFSLVLARAQNYLHTGERREYEFPGVLVDPWEVFQKHGFVGKPQFPSHPQLWIKRLDFAPGKMHPIRQILDRRVNVILEGGKFREPTRAEATLWLRDVYTDHYFDGWGEWIHVECGSKVIEPVLIHALLLEVDLMKQSDPISRLMRGKIRATIEENGQNYLEQAFRALQARVKAMLPSGRKALPQKGIHK